MARTCAQPVATTFLIYLSIGFSSVFAVYSASVLLQDSTDSLRPMILPLYHSSSNLTRKAFDRNDRRRYLQKSERPPTQNARLRLHDDLHTNGYYTTRLWIGTPPQEFALIVDTGSTVTYVPCSDCEQCGKHQDPRFQPELSATYRPVSCNIDCNCDDRGVQCIYERRYAEMSTSSGVLGEDLLSFGNESELVPQRAVFGCENVETGDLYSQRADGIMGLGRGPLSVMDQLVDKGVISDSFSLCYGGMDVGGGAMILGGISPLSGMVFTNSDPSRSPYYNIDLKEIHVAGKPLELKSSVFNGKYGTVLDSGTTYAYFPEKAFNAFRAAISKKTHFLKQIHGPDPNFDDICFSGAGRDISHLSTVFPEVDMVFSNGQKLSLSPENYLFQHTKVSGAYCLGILKNGNDQTTLLGGIVVRNTLVTYDRENSKIGFWKTNCSNLWKTLSAPLPPEPKPSHDRNTSTDPPLLSPGGAPPALLPGELQIGLITFDMMLHANSSYIKPNFTELTEFIAHELEVNASQVRLSNFTSNGNDFFLSWAIYPAQSSKYISITTAMSIISQLKEHRMQLPQKFGSYQLVELNIESPKKQTWWKGHLWEVTIGVTVTLVLVSFAVLGTWLIWGYQKRHSAPYEPIRTIVPEQELQPIQSY